MKTIRVKLLGSHSPLFLWLMLNWLTFGGCKMPHTRSTDDVLADLKSRLEALDAERARLLTAISVIEGSPVPETAPRKMPINVYSVSGPEDYAGMTITDAAIHFLRAEGKPAKTGDIARALKAGNIPSASKNLYRMVYNSLSHRANTKGDLKKSAGMWSLRR